MGNSYISVLIFFVNTKKKNLENSKLDEKYLQIGNKNQPKVDPKVSTKVIFKEACECVVVAEPSKNTGCYNNSSITNYNIPELSILKHN